MYSIGSALSSPFSGGVARANARLPAGRLVVDGPAACIALSYHQSDALSLDVHGATEAERAVLAAIDARAARDVSALVKVKPHSLRRVVLRPPAGWRRRPAGPGR